MPFDGSDLYQLANWLGLPPLERVAAGAGVISVLQISVYQSERTLRHSVARVSEYQTGEVELLLAYEGISLKRSIRRAVESERMERLQAVLLKARFDKLGDQASLSRNESLLWLIERAAGSHRHGIIIAPDRPELPWSAIVNAIDAYLPEAIRRVPLRT